MRLRGLVLGAGLIAGLLSCARSVSDGPFEEGGDLVKLSGGFGFVEGPIWMGGGSMLVFSDIPNGKLMQWSEADGVEVFREESAPNGNVLDGAGRLLTCRHGARDVVRTEADGALRVLATEWEGRRLNSPNDLAVHADGSVWFTDPPWGLAGQTEGREIEWNGVYRLDVETGQVDCVLRTHVMPNGIGFSPDSSVLYIADTGGHPSHPDPAMHEAAAVVTAYSVTGTSIAPTPIWQTKTRCDGMAVDEGGLIYTTSREGIVVLAPDTGAILTTLVMPESPANCCFGGADGRTLFITARTSLYSIRTTARGAVFAR
jgi:gluconolactonase